MDFIKDQKEDTYRPLADELRPQTLDDVAGQEHILGPDGMLRRIAESGRIPNLIFYGPSGVGKTTLATYIARITNRTFRKLNGTTSSTSNTRPGKSGIHSSEVIRCVSTSNCHTGKRAHKLPNAPAFINVTSGS